jgi:hypothetical protein
MANIPIWRRYVRFTGPNVEADVEEELRFHLEMQTEALIEEGLAPDRARDQAESRMGNVRALKDECLVIVARSLV